MKDAQGHGSNGRGGAAPAPLGGAARFSHDLSYAAYQSATLAAVPNVAGANLYRDLSEHAQHSGSQGVPHSGFSDADIRGIENG
jgi:hypothetical protein